MEQGKSILKNTLALTLPNFINPLISLGLVMLVSRKLGPSGFGEYSLVLSYGSIFMTAGSLGLSSLIVREVAKAPDSVHEWMTNGLLFGGLASLLAMALMNGVMHVVGYAPVVLTGALVFSFCLVPSTGVRYLEGVFRAYAKSEFYALIFFLENVFRVLLGAGLVLAGFGVVGLISSVTLAKFAGLVMFLFAYKKVLGTFSWKINPAIWKQLFRHSPVFASIAIASTIHLSIDTIMLSAFKDSSAVGIYSAADGLLGLCKTLPIAFASTMLTFFSREHSEGFEALKALVERSVKYLLLAVLPMVVGGVILADQLIGLVYGGDFTRAGLVLQFHLVSLIPFSLVFIFANLLISTNHQKVDLHINLVAMVVNIALNALLIPFFSELGAVAATLVTICVFNQLQLTFCKKNLFDIKLLPLLPRVAAATVLMGALTWVLRDLNVFVNITLSAAGYAGALLLLRALSPEEMDFLKALIKRRRGQA